MAEIQVIAGQGRPYEPLGMTTDKWKQISPQAVDVTTLTFSQDSLSVDGLLLAAMGKASYCGDPYPHIVRYRGQDFISDGHHRIMVAILQGRQTIQARVLEKQ